MTMFFKRCSLLLAALLFTATVLADTSYQPFVLASVNEDSVQARTAATRTALEEAGFTVAGQYAPLDNATVLVVTDPDLQAIAAQSDKGGYGAGQRVSISERDGKTEVAFVNPVYIQYAYRLGADMQGIRDRLTAALGVVSDFGAEKSMTANKLGKYHYKPLMERFDDPYVLASFDSHDAAVAAVENGLAAEGDALSLVYRIDVPGKDQAVFGVGMKAASDDESELNIDEAHQLSIVDFDGHSKVAYFPYEILVDGKNVEALHMRFRMAVHFPDLAMMGEHGFWSLKASPGAIQDAFEALVGGN
jgi:hypothetical protein